MSEKILLIVNPRSGTTRNQRRLLAMAEVLCTEGQSVSVYVTHAPHDGQKFVFDHSKEFDKIVSCGGDGTFNEVMTGTVNSGFAGDLAFVPCGTTNDYAKSLGLYADPVKACKLILSAKGKPIDIGQFGEDRYFSYVASFGAFTETSYATNQKAKNAIGHLAYIAGGINSLSSIKSHSVRITCGDEVITGDFIFGAVLNALSVGGVMKLPRNKVDFSDGRHEILLVRTPKNPAHFLSIFTDAVNGKFDPDSVLLLHSDSVKFEFDKKTDWCTDGEYAEAAGEINIKTLPSKIRLIRP